MVSFQETEVIAMLRLTGRCRVWEQKILRLSPRRWIALGFLVDVLDDSSRTVEETLNATSSCLRAAGRVR